MWKAWSRKVRESVEGRWGEMTVERRKGEIPVVLRACWLVLHYEEVTATSLWVVGQEEVRRHAAVMLYLSC